MTDAAGPVMSVVLATPSGYEIIRKTIDHLQAQTVRDCLEVVIVAPSANGLEPAQAELAGFRGVQVVEVGPIRSRARAYAAGIRRATAPVVALAEDHAFPDPDWAAALIAAHRDPWAVVGPAMRNGNPGSVVSWAEFLIAYSRWMEPVAAQAIDHLPGHNSSYKRATLLSYGRELEALLDAESILHWDLQAKGHRLYLEPMARTRHMNFTRLSSWLPVELLSARMFAATRARSARWSWPQRLLYAGAAPLIPLVRLRRIVREVRRAGQQQVLPRALPVLVAGLAMSAAGELAGYAFGVGDTRRRLCSRELGSSRSGASYAPGSSVRPAREIMGPSGEEE